MLGASSQPLSTAYDLAICDLDGVVYAGKDAIAGAVASLNAAQDGGMRVGYLTNNASRPTEDVAQHLRELGLHTSTADVVNSAQAAASLLAGMVPTGAAVFCVGGPGLEEALGECGLRPVYARADDPVAVVQGYGPDVPWHRIMLGARLVAEGLPWVVTNRDLTLPTADGLAPGNGALVRLIVDFAGREPLVAGKPEATALEEANRRLGGKRPLVIGDRLDTDIAGAVNAAFDSLLVMTGVTDLSALVGCTPRQRPTYIAPDLRGLHDPQPAVESGGSESAVGGWRAEVSDERLRVAGEGTDADWWRVVATAAWRHLDATGSAADTTGLVPPERRPAG